MTKEEILALYEKAKQGDAESQYEMGRLYAAGNGVKQNPQQAALWYGKAAAQGYGQAQAGTGGLPAWKGDTQDAKAAAQNSEKQGSAMLDGEQNANKMPKAFSKLEGTPFTGFAKPYLDLIGKGKLPGVFYIVMAVINLALPFAIFYKAVDEGLFGLGEANIIFAFIFAWIVTAFACWIGFQLWWDRRSRIKAFEGSEFIVTFIFSDIIQTLGEWLGTMIGIIGAGVGLIAVLFLGGYANYLYRMIGMDFMPSGILAVFAGPLIGFIIIILFRFIAEQIRLFCALVNNTKSIADNIKGPNTWYTKGDDVAGPRGN